jgi:hypothetical protein
MFMPHFGQGGRTSKQVKARLSSLAEQFLSKSAGKHREGVRLEIAWTIAIPDSNAGWSVTCQQRCFSGYLNREAHAV